MPLKETRKFEGGDFVGEVQTEFGMELDKIIRKGRERERKEESPEPWGRPMVRKRRMW